MCSRLFFCIKEYLGNYIYEKPPGSSAKLQFFSTPEGYVTPKNINDYSQGFDYIYQYKDHLGNIRLSYTEDPSNPGQPTIIEENNYYPFGLKHKGYNTGGDNSLGDDLAQKWKFGGKELDESLGLDTYDFGARNYNPSIGRWMSMDPVTHYSMSPYNAFDNNPAFWADPSGANAECPSCQTEDDWNNYYSQLDNAALAFGANSFQEAALKNDHLSVGFDEDGHTIGYSNGTAIDIVQYDNQFDAITSFVADGVMPEGPGKLFKFISNIFKSGGEEVVDLGKRATEIHSTLKPGTQSRTTTAVAEVADEVGEISYVVASSEKRLRPAQRAALKSNETAAVGAGHAEVTAINSAQNSGNTVLRVGASRPICAGCETAINSVGAQAASPLKRRIPVMGSILNQK